MYRLYIKKLTAAPIVTVAPVLPLLASAVLAPLQSAGLNVWTVGILLGLGALYVFVLSLPAAVVGGAVTFAWLLVGAFAGGPVVLRALAAGCCAALPLLVAEAWNLFLPLFEKELKLWEADRSKPMTRAVLFLETLPIEIRIAKPFAGGILAAAPLIAPATMPLGEVFTHFLDDEESNRRQLLPGGKLAWYFHTSRLGEPRYLDPALSLQQNRVPADTVITATAVEVTPLLHSSNIPS